MKDKVWTGKYWMTEENTKKISNSLKEYYKKNNIWNKGLKYGKYDEPSAKRLRRDKKYYLKELEDNAKRSRVYDLTKDRRDEIKNLRKFYQKETGAGRKRRLWSDEDIDYLKKNYKNRSNLEMALDLERSWMSIQHKLCRLNLITYHKYN